MASRDVECAQMAFDVLSERGAPPFASLVEAFTGAGQVSRAVDTVFKWADTGCALPDSAIRSILLGPSPIDRSTRRALQGLLSGPDPEVTFRDALDGCTSTTAFSGLLRRVPSSVRPDTLVHLVVCASRVNGDVVGALRKCIDSEAAMQRALPVAVHAGLKYGRNDVVVDAFAIARQHSLTIAPDQFRTALSFVVVRNPGDLIAAFNMAVQHGMVPVPGTFATMFQSLSHARPQQLLEPSCRNAIRALADQLARGPFEMTSGLGDAALRVLGMAGIPDAALRVAVQLDSLGIPITSRRALHLLAACSRNPSGQRSRTTHLAAIESALRHWKVHFTSEDMPPILALYKRFWRERREQIISMFRELQNGPARVDHQSVGALLSCLRGLSPEQAPSLLPVSCKFGELRPTPSHYVQVISCLALDRDFDRAAFVLSQLRNVARLRLFTGPEPNMTRAYNYVMMAAKDRNQFDAMSLLRQMLFEDKACLMHP